MHHSCLCLRGGPLWWTTQGEVKATQRAIGLTVHSVEQLICSGHWQGWMTAKWSFLQTISHNHRFLSLKKPGWPVKMECSAGCTRCIKESTSVWVGPKQVHPFQDNSLRTDVLETTCYFTGHEENTFWDLSKSEWKEWSKWECQDKSCQSWLSASQLSCKDIPHCVVFPPSAFLKGFRHFYPYCHDHPCNLCWAHTQVTHILGWHCWPWCMVTMVLTTETMDPLIL